MDDIYQFKITLADSNPPIWRRVLVPSSYSLNQLHQVIQMIFEWEGYHLFAFELFGQPFDNQTPGALSKRINQLGLEVKNLFTYRYDFGDDWEHKILLEKCLPKKVGQHYPYCVTGKRAGPPEDCGGIWSYEHRLAVLADQKHPEYQDIYEWMGGPIDPEVLNVDDINKRLGDW